MHSRFPFSLAGSALAALVLSACTDPRVKERTGGASVELEKRADGLVYRKDGATPFTGETVFLDEDQERKRTESYAGGKASGVWLKWWPRGRRLKAESTWVDGAQVRERKWYADGTPKEDAAMKSGKAFGLMRLWWPNGRLRRQVYLEDNLALHGHLLEYAADGTVLWDAIFEHGQYRAGKGPAKDLANIPAQQQ